MHSLEERYFRTGGGDAGHRIHSFLTCRLAHSIPFSARSELMRYRQHCDRLLHEPSPATFRSGDATPEALRNITRDGSSGIPPGNRNPPTSPPMLQTDLHGTQPAPAARSEEIAAQLFRFWDAVLDTSPGPAWLVHPAVAEFTQVTLHAMEGILCRLEAYTILPTHVHVLYSQNVELHRGPAPMHVADGLKSPVEHFASRILDLRGPFWQKDDYHRILRSSREVDSVRRYIRRDPVRAGLVDIPEEWLWSWERKV